MPDSRRGTIGAVWSRRRPFLNGAKTGPAHRPYFWGGGGILAAVVAAWPDLPEAIKAGILAIASDPKSQTG